MKYLCYYNLHNAKRQKKEQENTPCMLELMYVVDEFDLPVHHFDRIVVESLVLSWKCDEPLRTALILQYNFALGLAYLLSLVVKAEVSWMVEASSQLLS